MLGLMPSPLSRLRARITPFMAFATAVTVFMAFVIIYPLVRMIFRAFSPEGELDLSAFEILTQPQIHQTIINTGIALGAAVVAATLLGSAFAWLNERTDASMGMISDVLPILPLMIPPVAGAIGWVFLASEGAGLLNGLIRNIMQPFGVTIRSGPLNITSWTGLIFVYTLYLVPIVYLVVSSSLRGLDSSFEEASRVSGASAFGTFRRITLPAIAPSVASAAVLALVIGLALFSIPVVIATSARIDILAVEIINRVREFPPQRDAAIVLGLVMLVIISVAWSVQFMLRKAGNYASIGGRASHGSRTRLGTWKTPARAVMILYLAATSVLPFSALVFVSMQNFWSPNIDWGALNLDAYGEVFVQDRATVTAIRNSGLLAFVGATLAVLIALVVAYFVVRTRTAGRAADGIVKLPGAVSNIIVGVAFLISFGGAPFQLAGTLWILLLAYITINMPQASLTAGTALERIGPDLWEASYVSGASETTTFRKILLPLARPGLVAGWAMVFVLMAGDLAVSSMLASTGTRVVGFVLLDLWQFGIYPKVATFAVGISVLSFTVVGTVLLLTRRQGGAGLLAKSTART